MTPRTSVACIQAVFFVILVACFSGCTVAPHKGNIDVETPTAENVLRAIKTQMMLETYPLSLAPCLPIDMTRTTSVEGVFAGLTDLYPRPGSPGTSVLTMTLRTPNTYAQERRDRTLDRMDALAAIGFFARRETVLVNSAGYPDPALEYALTADGWKHIQNNACFSIGKVEILEIVSGALLAPNAQGIPRFEVRFRVGVREFSDWTQRSEVAKHISETLIKNEVGSQKVHSLILLKGKIGWVPEGLAKFGKPEGEFELDKDIDRLMPIPDQDAWRRAVTDVPIKACLLLPSKPEIDAVELKSTPSGLSAAYFAGSAMLPETKIHRAWRRRLDGLARAGLFVATPIPADAARNRKEGVRYTLAEKYVRHIDEANPACLVLAKAELVMQREIWNIYSYRNADRTLFGWSSSGSGLARIPPDGWFRNLDLTAAPEVNAYLTHGIPVWTSLELQDGEWRMHEKSISKIQQFYPWDEYPAPEHELLPKVASGGELHLVSVYKPTEGTIDVDVKRKGRPLMVLLSAYDAVTWKVTIRPNVRVSAVVLMGDKQGKVSFVGKRTAPVIFASRRLPEKKSSVALRADRGYWGINDIERLFGRRPDSWQMAYEIDCAAVSNATPLDQVTELKPIGAGNVSASSCKSNPASAAGSVGKRSGSASTSQQSNVGVKAEWGTSMTLPPGGWIVGEDPATGKPVIKPLSVQPTPSKVSPSRTPSESSSTIFFNNQ